jgi:hypothetical protein
VDFREKDALCQDEGMAKDDQIKFTLDADLKKEFQRQCLERDEKMTPVLRKLVWEWCNDSGIANNVERRATDFVKSLASDKPPSNSEIAELAQLIGIEKEALHAILERIFPDP